MGLGFGVWWITRARGDHEGEAVRDEVFQWRPTSRMKRSGRIDIPGRLSPNPKGEIPWAAGSQGGGRRMEGTAVRAAALSGCQHAAWGAARGPISWVLSPNPKGALDEGDGVPCLPELEVAFGWEVVCASKGWRASSAGGRSKGWRPWSAVVGCAQVLPLLGMWSRHMPGVAFGWEVVCASKDGVPCPPVVGYAQALPLLGMWSRHMPEVAFGWEVVCASKGWPTLSAGERMCEGFAFAPVLEWTQDGSPGWSCVFILNNSQISLAGPQAAPLGMNPGRLLWAEALAAAWGKGPGQRCWASSSGGIVGQCPGSVFRRVPRGAPLDRDIRRHIRTRVPV
ncbi:hypothetical protein CYMTET_23443 [Cymbomonas tetramitiformis]|uniref:Uncharacterized protein n=1 Tax=Cymbomonas tetramitiformis TaxID=36881 RepID=A0AAE0FYF5_9CHLO|nr:hypothetical protein CYMTET_23443 [Cymbomonas tetramitiformis]